MSPQGRASSPRLVRRHVLPQGRFEAFPYTAHRLHTLNRTVALSPARPQALVTPEQLRAQLTQVGSLAAWTILSLLGAQGTSWVGATPGALS